MIGVYEMTLKLEPSVFWTDSTSVLRYIRNENKRFQTFVANQLASIHDITETYQWRFVPSEQNPADMCSRGIITVDDRTSSQWLTPALLLKPESEWPIDTFTGELNPEDPEVCKSRHQSHSTSSVVLGLDALFKYYSSWTKLKRSIAHFLRIRAFLQNKAKSRRDPNVSLNNTDQDFTRSLTANELVNAETCIIKYTQSTVYADEIESLKSHRIVSKNSSIRDLRPFIDKQGILRIQGRLSLCNSLDLESKHVVIIPGKHPIAELLICHQHIACGHMGRNHVLSQLRQKFWITQGTAAVKRVIGRCFDCRRRHAPAMEQPMADLPEDRINPKSPFSSVGVDYFGPFLVRIGRRTEKRYGCIFSCLVSRAIHIEIAYSLDSDSFINALQRFIARRGVPSVIRSDNGSNFVSANKELRRMLENWNQSKIINHLSQSHCEWIFNPPAASHWGGTWERQIRTVRQIINGILKEQALNDESLQTLMCLVESIMNGRPITNISTDPSDLEALTPNHLLIMRPGAIAPPGIFSKNDNDYAKRRWRQIQYLANVYWKRWLQEYLPLLQSRTKWTGETVPLAVDDLVVVNDQRVHRHYWPLARIVKIFPGRDGSVRSVQLKTKQGTLTRPVTKICRIEGSD
jgi:hypothetical protein